MLPGGEQTGLAPVTTGLLFPTGRLAVDTDIPAWRGIRIGRRRPGFTPTGSSGASRTRQGFDHQLAKDLANMAEAAWRWMPFLVAVTRAVRLTGAAFPTVPAQRLCRRSIAKGTEATFPPGDTPTALDIRAGMPCFRMNSRFRDVAGRPRASPAKGLRGTRPDNLPEPGTPLHRRRGPGPEPVSPGSRRS